MRKNIAILCLLGIALGCSKSKDPDNSVEPGRYNTSSTITINNVLMYTKGGQVADTSRIRIYLQQHGLTNIFAWKVSSEPNNLGTIEFDLTTEKYVHATINNNKSQYEITEKSESLWVLTSVDSASYFKDPPSPDDCSDFNGVNPQRHLSPEKCVPVSGGSELCKRRTVIPINLKNNSLLLPLFTVRIQKANNCWFYIPNELNNFNEYLTTALETGDTLLVQTKELPLTKIQ